MIPSLRTLSAVLFLAVAGCAALPGTDLIGGCLNDRNASVDGGCINGESGTSDAAFSIDAGGEVVSPPANAARSLLCSGTQDAGKPACDPNDPYACSGDGGLGDGGKETCHLTLAAKQQSVAQCLSETNSHADGESCTVGTDCKAGYECVGTPGTCRHYCCAGDCSAMSNNQQNQAYFCDVQLERSSSAVKVPVCMPVIPCQLFHDACGPNSTCTLVDPSNGVASCETLGTAKVGESCEIDHCGADLVCVGPPGQRTCQQLCDPSHGCTYPQHCDDTWAALQALNVGICQ